MKQIICLTLLLIVIPFFVVIISIQPKENKIDEPEPKSKLFVRVKRETTGKIEQIELEEYVIGVIAGEMPISFNIEALKAQAVAARSYVLKRIDANQNKDYDVVDSVTNQVYLDDEYLHNRWQEKYSDNIAKLRRAVAETSLEYISYNGEIADALFFSTSNGFTENSEEIFSYEVPYLRKVESVWDATTSPVFNDQKTYSLNTFYEILGLSYSNELKVEIIQKSSTGRILKIKINGVEMKGSDVATKLKLRSNDFEIIRDGNTLNIKTNGYGHGVGMSQYGALGMANEGYLYDEILKHYYKGVEIKKIVY